MRPTLISKHRIPEVGTTDSISAEIEDDLAELLNRELRLRSPRNEARSKKAKSTGSQPDLLEKFRSKLRDR